MKIKLTINLGTRDLARYGLEQGFEGDVVDVSEKDGKELLKKSYAVEAGKDAEPPAKIQAVPPVDLKTSPATKPIPGK